MRVLRFVLVMLFVVGCKSQKSAEVICGGLGDFTCPPEQYCKMKQNCGGIDAEGVCAPRPLTCPSVSEPVCGCDGKNYSSECFAAARGISVRTAGKCAAEQEIGDSE